MAKQYLENERYVQALNESKDRNDKLKQQNLGLFKDLLLVEGFLEDYEGEENA